MASLAWKHATFSFSFVSIILCSYLHHYIKYFSNPSIRLFIDGMFCVCIPNIRFQEVRKRCQLVLKGIEREKINGARRDDE